ncbi:MAG: putative hydrolase, CocE/NonD family, partial [Actinomycetia bacterium]|nr:putative hydrolase, CocE/NonD family [Actinomycetes bacterium]
AASPPGSSTTAKPKTTTTGPSFVDPNAGKTTSATYHVGGSVQQVYVTDATPGAKLVLLHLHKIPVAHGVADKSGSYIFRDVPFASDYTVVSKQSGKLFASPTFQVMSPADAPPKSLYTGQALQPGLNYLRTRDGTTLAAMVRLPAGKTAADGPFPTVVEYSGYDVANPDTPQPSTLAAGQLGFATVGVNMRGTGCSGGAYSFFENLQSLDGYDAVETVAAQPWVLHHKVGMVGISYSGISQLFVGATQPPHLAAIAPLSVLDDFWRGEAYPGGIPNTGFAAQFARERDAAAQPSGQPWVVKRIAQGDVACSNNQKLRGQNVSLLKQESGRPFYQPLIDDPLSPYTFVDQIQVPVFIAGSFTDEQTGPHFTDMLDHFGAFTKVEVTLFNGMHADAFAPQVAERWAEFLFFYVALQVPRIPDSVKLAAPAFYSQLMGVNGLQLPAGRFNDYGAYKNALDVYEGEPRVRVLFDNGAAPGQTPGAPLPGFEAEFTSWPPPAATARLYFGPNGTLTDAKPTGAAAAATADTYQYDPTAFPATDYTGDDAALWKTSPAYDWRPLPGGKGVGYTTPPLPRDTVVVGPGSVDLWLKSTARDTDLEVTLTEVRPDGKETYVQSGWLRASQRALDPGGTTDLAPRHTHLKRDAAPLPKNKYTLSRVELPGMGHAFRSGSRIRITVQAPGGNRPRWSFTAQPAKGIVMNSIARDVKHASSIALPVVSSVPIPTRLPACGSLRGEPCRTFVPAANGG